MTRVAVLAVSLAFILGFAILTIEELSSHGLTVAGALSVVVLALLAIGIIGALRNPPR